MRYERVFFFVYQRIAIILHTQYCNKKDPSVISFGCWIYNHIVSKSEDEQRQSGNVPQSKYVVDNMYCTRTNLSVT